VDSQIDAPVEQSVFKLFSKDSFAAND